MLSCMGGRMCDEESSNGGKEECGLDVAIPYFVSFIFFCSFLVSTCCSLVPGTFREYSL